MEDILEEIVGNIMDEYDEEEEFITPGPDGSYVMSGLTPLDDVMDTLEMEFDQEVLDAYDTLYGYLVSRLARIESVLVQKLPREQPEEKKELVEEKNDAVSKEHQGDVS